MGEKAEKISLTRQFSKLARRGEMRIRTKRQIAKHAVVYKS